MNRRHFVGTFILALLLTGCASEAPPPTPTDAAREPTATPQPTLAPTATSEPTTEPTATTVPAPEPVATTEAGNFTWDFYRFERSGGNVADLVMAEDNQKAYFVYMVSTPDEHDALYEQLFLPAVAAMTAL